MTREGGTIDILKAVKALDKELVTMGEQFTLYICGGAALIFLGFTARKTEDIDFIEVDVDPSLQKAIERVAKKLRYEPDWLNNDVADLGRRLGKGWKKKCTVAYDGDGVRLMMLSRKDLISSKFHSLIERGTGELPDLIFLKPDEEEIRIAAKYALEQGLASNIETYEVWVKQYVKLLREELGYG